MRTTKLFSQREKEKLPQSTAYVYDRIPQEFKIQVLYILNRVLGQFPESNCCGLDDDYNVGSGRFWETIIQILCEEWGRLCPIEHESYFEVIKTFILQSSIDKCLDILDLVFQGIDQGVRKFPINGAQQTPDEAIEELNRRFKEHGLGYQFVHKIVRVDSEYLHNEAIVSALVLLRDHHFQGAEAEFSKAQNHYKNCDYKEAIGFANDALESTLKTICDRQNWQYQKRNTAKDLIGIIFEHELIPPYLKDHFHSLQNLLEKGGPVVRNQSGSHGQGGKIIDVPQPLAAYALHIAASNILLLVEFFNSKSGR